jgi:hypothetical protein
MKSKRWILGTGFTIIAASIAVARAAPLGTGFTYQGQLKKVGVPVNAHPPGDGCDFRFTLWSDSEEGTPFGQAQNFIDQDVTNGLFTLTLNEGNEFGPSAFNGDARWLEIHVACPPTPAAPRPWPFVNLGRQKLTPAPYAIHAASGGGGGGGGTLDDAYDFGGAGAGRTITADSGPVEILGPDGLDVAGTIQSGSSITIDGTAGSENIAASGDLDVKTAGARVLRLESNEASGPFYGPNVIGGSEFNSVTSGVGGATVAGGGGRFVVPPNAPIPNRVYDGFGTVGGGMNNTAGSSDSEDFNAPFATVGGGYSNRASEGYSTVPGGWGNVAGGEFSLAAGRQAKVRDSTDSGDADGDEGTFVWADAQGVVFQSTGPNQFLVRAANGVGINKDNPQPGALDVNGPAIVTGFQMAPGAGAGKVLISDASGNATWQVPTPGGAIGGSGTANYIPKFTGPAAIGNSAIYESGGNVGIGTSAPDAKLHIGDGDIFADDYGTGTGSVTPEFVGRRARGTSALPTAVETNDWLVNFVGAGHDGTAFAHEAWMSICAAELWTTSAHGTYFRFLTTGLGSLTTAERMRIDPAGNVGIGTTNPADHRLWVKSAGTGAGGSTLHVENTAATGIAATLDSNSTDVTLLASNHGTGDIIRADSWQGGWHEVFKVTNNGTTSVSVLEVRGADIAEKFPVSDSVEPGMVVEIDSDNPGQLHLAHGAYNRRVAGVVSGANGLSAGAILGNLPGHEDAPPIALSGRVWVYCDASNGAIQPGDLLTTSDTPGHAMKVTDYPRAQGAILGKAMGALDEGHGLVLVLVTLQ